MPGIDVVIEGSERMFYENVVFIGVSYMHLKVHENHVVAIERVVHLKGKRNIKSNYNMPATTLGGLITDFPDMYVW